MCSYVIRTNGYDVYTRWSTVSSLMINSIIFMVEFLWFNIIRDTLLLFEQFLYVWLLSGIVPGSFYLMDWVLNWLNGFYLNGINKVQIVCVDIEWSQQIEENLNQNIVGNVFGRRNVVGKHMNLQMVNYIGSETNE